MNIYAKSKTVEGRYLLFDFTKLRQIGLREGSYIEVDDSFDSQFELLNASNLSGYCECSEDEFTEVLNSFKEQILI